MSLVLAWVSNRYAVVRSDGLQRFNDGRPPRTNVQKVYRFGDDLLLGHTGAVRELWAIRQCIWWQVHVARPRFDVLCRTVKISCQRIAQDDLLHGVSLILISRAGGRIEACSFGVDDHYQPHHAPTPCLLTNGSPADNPEFIRASDPLVLKLGRATLPEVEHFMDEALELGVLHGAGKVGGNRYKHTLTVET